MNNLSYTGLIGFAWFLLFTAWYFRYVPVINTYEWGNLQIIPYTFALVLWIVWVVHNE
jgi:hypothetical protein